MDIQNIIEKYSQNGAIGFIGIFKIISSNKVYQNLQNFDNSSDLEILAFQKILITLSKDIDKGKYDELFFEDYDRNTKILSSTFYLIEQLFDDLNSLKQEDLSQSEDVDSMMKLLVEGILIYISLFVFRFIRFIPEYKLINEHSELEKYYKEYNEQIKDKRKTAKPITNNEKLKALTEFCPELIKRLHNLKKYEQEQVIHLITGVNKVDAYKKVMTAEKKEIENTTFKNHEIDIEDLKNKLNIT